MNKPVESDGLSFGDVMKKLIQVLVSPILVLGVMLGIATPILTPAPAHAYIEIDSLLQDEGKLKNVKEIYTALKELGYGDAAKLALMANINVESTFEPSVVNHLGCSGLFQYCFGRKDNFVSKVSKWETNIKGQIKFMEEELPSTQIMTTDPASNPNMDGYPAEMRKKYNSVDELKKEKDFKVLLNQWLTLWEIPCIGYDGCAHERSMREGMAEQMKAKWKEIFGVEYGSDGGVTVEGDKCKTGDGQRRNTDTGQSGSNNSGSSTSDCAIPGGKGVVSEEDLFGMPNLVNLADGQVSIVFAGRGSLNDNERLQLEIVKGVRQNDIESRGYSYLAVALGVLGTLVMMWAVLVVVSYLVDISMTFLGISTSRVITLGKIDVVKEMEDPNGHPGMRIFIMSFCLFILGSGVLGGAMFGVVEFFWNMWNEVTRWVV